VILWQDPYHWENQAHWLCFSVQNWEKIPPSLKNIFKEIKSDIWLEISKNGNLEKWWKQGILLLNSILTVEKGKPASHKKIWWDKFTDFLIKKISDEKKWVIFVLWGNFAKSKKILINEKKHFILESAHPSPFSVKNFSWNKHFSKINNFLKKEINWEN
jgi:uracil-DNA glycosylase